MEKKACEICNSTTLTQPFHGYEICDSCKKDLRLFKPSTVKEHTFKYGSITKHKSEIENRLKLLKIDFIQKELKLRDILSKIDS